MGPIVETQMFWFSPLSPQAISPGLAKDSPSSPWLNSRIMAIRFLKGSLLKQFKYQIPLQQQLMMSYGFEEKKTALPKEGTPPHFRTTF